MYFPSGSQQSTIAFGGAPQYVAVNAFPGAISQTVPPTFSQAIASSTLLPPQYSASSLRDAVGGNASSAAGFPAVTAEQKAPQVNSAAATPETTAVASSVSGGWGLSVASSPASSLTSQPYYFVLQPQMPYGALPPAVVVQQSPAVACPPPSTRQPTQDNGSKYVLGETYEGVVKRYNPMRGFGFLTATHHIKQKAEGNAQDTGEANAGGEGTTGTANETSAGVKGNVVCELVSVGDIFVHQSYIQMQGFRALDVGERVFFRVGVLHSKRAHQAVDVRRVEDVLSGGDGKHSNSNSGVPSVEAQGTAGGGGAEAVGQSAQDGADEFALPSMLFEGNGEMEFADTEANEAEHTLPPIIGTGDGDSSEDEICSYIGKFEEK